MIVIGCYCDKCGVGLEWTRNITDYRLEKYIIIRRMRECGYTIGKQILCPNCKRGSAKKND